MTNIFEDLQKQAAETQERWTEIKKRADELKEVVVPGGSVELCSIKTAELVLLLVQQFQPMVQIEGDDFMKNILESLTGGKTK